MSIILDEWDKNHLRNWVAKHAPVSYSQRDEAANVMIRWLETSDEADYAYNAGWPTVFRMAGVELLVGIPD